MNKYTLNNFCKKVIFIETIYPRILLFLVEHNPIKTDIIRYYVQYHP